MRQALVAMAVALVLSRAASAEITLSADVQYVDHFSADSQVAGQVLVGLWLGEPRPKVSLDPIHFLLPSRPNQAKVCISVNTRDGEYGGEGIYDVRQGDPEQGNLSIQSKYQANLANYAETDLGIRAELKPDCTEAAPGRFIPAVAGGPPATLVALVNGQRAVHVGTKLLRTQAGSPVANGECRSFPPGSGRSTAFDTVCRITLPAALANSDYFLVVERRTRAGDTERDTFRVGLGEVAR